MYSPITLLQRSGARWVIDCNVRGSSGWSLRNKIFPFFQLRANIEVAGVVSGLYSPGDANPTAVPLLLEPSIQLTVLGEYLAAARVSRSGGDGTVAGPQAACWLRSLRAVGAGIAGPTLYSHRKTNSAIADVRSTYTPIRGLGVLPIFLNLAKVYLRISSLATC